MLTAGIRSVAFDSTSDFAPGRLYLRVIVLIWLFKVLPFLSLVAHQSFSLLEESNDCKRCCYDGRLRSIDARYLVQLLGGTNAWPHKAYWPMQLTGTYSSLGRPCMITPHLFVAILLSSG